MQRIKIMLPGYNEERSLPSLLKRIETVNTEDRLGLEVLFVNDGSTDNTLEAVKQLGLKHVKILDLQPNRGLAGAMREGFREVLRDMDDDDILVTMDADDSHDPILISRMVSQIREGSDIVIASRYRPGSRIVGLSKSRKALSSLAGYLFRIFTPIHGVRDYTCGYRAYRAALLKKADVYYGKNFIEQKGFGCMAEILLKLRVLNPIVHELPFVLRYDQKQSDSKMNVLKTVRQTISLIITSGRKG